MSPFKALYGQDCITPLIWSDPTIRVETSLQMQEEMEEQTRLICKEIKAAQDCQKQYAYTKSSDRVFKEGDMVFLRVWPKHSSFSLGKYKKLSPKYCGQYTITKRINDQAYQPLIPPYLKVHNVFHISLLKAYVPSLDHVLNDEQVPMPTQGLLELEPEQILSTRERKLRNRSIIEHLVQWKHFSVEDATWEDQSTLYHDFPQLIPR